jgi:dolichyl-phosphate-mannose-protein mannosyltransferase
MPAGNVQLPAAGYAPSVPGLASRFAASQMRRRLEAAFDAARATPLPPTNVTLALISIGLIFRIANFASNPALWLDEAFLALNLRDRDLSGILGTLDFNQAAPPLYLLAEKGSVLAFGDSEYALRAFPLLAGIVALGLFPSVARHFLGRWPAVLAVGLFVVLGPLIYVSAQVKQYSSDVAIAVVLLYAVSRIPTSRSIELREAVMLGLVGAVALWFSYPAIFYVSGFGLVLFGVRIARRQWRSVGMLAVSAAICTASVVPFLLYSLDRVRDLQTGLRGSPTAYAPISGSGADLGWFVHAPGRLLGESAGLDSHHLAALLVLVGFVSLLRRDPELALLLGSPLLVAVVASALDKYPFGGRFSIFYVPALLCLVAEGVGALVIFTAQAARRFRLRQLTPAMAGGAALALIAAIGLVPARNAVTNLVSPSGREETKALIETMQHGWKKGDAVYIFYPTQYAFRYYAECGACGVADRTGRARELWVRVRPMQGREWFAPALESRPPKLVVGRLRGDPVAQLDRFRGQPRVWALFSHFSGRVSVILSRLDALGTRVSKLETTGATLYLYDLRAR